jgi:beta-N-acetylhexosaminidase
MNNMSVEDKVGQMLVVGFDGLVAPDYLLEWLRAGRVGGVILFNRNVDSPEQLAELTRSLHQASKYPLVISIDQEGGTVARMRHGFTESPGALALASNPNNREANVEQASKILGEEMHAMGINWNYAPAVDILYNTSNPTLGTRSFGTTPQEVAQLAVPAVRGFQAGGVAACAKHFPGLGDTAIDTHLDLPRLDTSIDELRENDLIPYFAITENGIASIMTTHTIFTTLDPDYPATLSSVIIKRLLREEMNYQGVVTTDCMEMKAIDDYYGVADSTVRAALASVDMILVSHTPEKQEKAYEALLDAVKTGAVPMEIVDQANARISQLKADFPALTEPDLSQIRKPENVAFMIEVAKGAITHPRGELPKFTPETKIFLVEFAGRLDTLVQENTRGSNLSHLVKAHMPNSETILFPPNPSAEELRQVDLSQADIVIFALRNAHFNKSQGAIVQELSQQAKQSILLSLRAPHDINILSDSPVLTTCGDSLPSLIAVMQVLLGELVPSGQIPFEVV